uniref:Ig-like domain-containing protein n=1 Tax=Xenopus tropicalis TaxID=8364 RepID=A0A803JYL7_XENTR
MDAFFAAQCNIWIYICCISGYSTLNYLLSFLSKEGVILFEHLPFEHHLTPGKTAVFICNISALNFNPTDINWSKTHNNNTSKIADIKSPKDTNRIHIETNWPSRIAELHIRNVTVNDSGEYHCEYLNVTANSKIMLSNRSRLNVTAPKGDYFKDIILILKNCFLFLINKTGPYPEVITVDYGVLAFPNNCPYRKSVELCTLDQVEYATIMFPQGTPSLGERSGKDAACNRSPRVCRD